MEQINRQLSSGTGGYTVLDENATIEHILPQTPNAAWKTELGADFARFEEFVHTLGNLTLVTQEWNSSLSNASFAVKKAKLASHALRLNSDYFSLYIPHWNEMAIQARSNYLIDRILQIWPRISSENDGDEPATQEAANFHPQVIEAVSIHLGVVLIKQSLTQYVSEDGTVRVTCAVSKAYPKTNTNDFWYRFDQSQREFLDQVEQGYAAFGCGSAHTIVLLPLATLLPLTNNMRKTVSGSRDYWHVKLYEKGNQILLGQPGLESSVDITAYRIPGQA